MIIPKTEGATVLRYNKRHKLFDQWTVLQLCFRITGVSALWVVCEYMNGMHFIQSTRIAVIAGLTIVELLITDVMRFYYSKIRYSQITEWQSKGSLINWMAMSAVRRCGLFVGGLSALPGAIVLYTALLHLPMNGWAILCFIGGLLSLLFGVLFLVWLRFSYLSFYECIFWTYNIG